MDGQAGERPIVFRNKPFLAFGYASLAVIALVFGLGASDIAGGGTFAIAVFIAAVSYIVWLMCCNSSVRMDRSGMIVDDVLTRYVISWEKLRQIQVDGGIVIEVWGGPYLHPKMYGGSLYGLVTGYRRQRKVAARMNAAREMLQASRPAPQSSAHYAEMSALSLWPPLVILAVMEAIAALGVLAK